MRIRVPQMHPPCVHAPPRAPIFTPEHLRRSVLQARAHVLNAEGAHAYIARSACSLGRLPAEASSESDIQRVLRSRPSRLRRELVHEGLPPSLMGGVGRVRRSLDADSSENPTELSAAAPVSLLGPNASAPPVPLAVPPGA